MLLLAHAIWVAIPAVALAAIVLRAYLRKRRYRRLLHESIARQPHHEVDYSHRGGQTISLRVETIVRRFEKKLRAAGLHVPARAELRETVKEALCLPLG